MTEPGSTPTPAVVIIGKTGGTPHDGKDFHSAGECALSHLLRKDFPNKQTVSAVDHRCHADSQLVSPLSEARPIALGSIGWMTERISGYSRLQLVGNYILRASDAEKARDDAISSLAARYTRNNNPSPSRIEDNRIGCQALQHYP